MKFKDILKQAGPAVLSAIFPQAAPIIAAVNAFLPDDEKLPSSATGQEVEQKLKSLPSPLSKKLAEAEIDLEIAKEQGHTERFKAMIEADMAGASTRPKIAILFAYVVAVTIVGYIGMIVWTGQKLTWEEVAAILGIPSFVLRSYFAMRTDEKKARYQAVSGVEFGGMGKAIKGLFTGK